MLLNTITSTNTIFNTNTITSNTFTIAQRDLQRHIFVPGKAECCVFGNFHFLEFSPLCLDCWQYPTIWFSANFTQCLATFDAFCITAAVNESWMGVKCSFFSSGTAFFLLNIHNCNFQRYLTHCADIFLHYHIKSHFRIDLAIGHSWTYIFTHTHKRFDCQKMHFLHSCSLGICPDKT